MMGTVPRGRLIVLAAACWVMVATGCSRQEFGRQAVLSAADIDSIAAADRGYATAWLTNQPVQVLATLTEDATLMPSGLPALEGTEAIRGFWWPEGSPPTTVTKFTLAQREIGGSGDLGYVRGSFTLAFDYDGNAYTNRGDYLSLLRRLPDSSWRISHRAWNDLPDESDQ